ncbi:MAG: bifunctional oligoribonuclease/PAP phosphatase NrnA, partial [Myxococcota bacterium]
TVHNKQSFLLTAHHNPDGDAIGSVLGLYALLKHLGKDVVFYNNTPYPQRFQFLANAQQVQTEISNEARFDASIICDCGELARTPNGFLKDRDRLGTLIVIDHHPTSGLEGDINLNDPEQPATASLIVRLAQRLNIPLKKDFAEALYVGILTDTGCFRYQKTRPQTFRDAATLLEAGVDPWTISSAIYESNPLAQQKLLALVLNTLDLRHNAQLAFLHVDPHMFDQTGGDSSMTDGFVNFARGIRGVEVAGFFRPIKQGWKVSLRSRGNVNLSEIAAHFGGGGHAQAAGAIMEMSLEQAKNQLTEALTQALAKN